MWKPVWETTTGLLTGLVRHTINTYDDDTGNLLSKQSMNDQGVSPIEGYTYDAYGNERQKIEPRGYDEGPGFTTITTYDTATRTYPVQIQYPSTSGVAHAIQKQWNYKFGKVSVETDENGNNTVYAYDPFGRIDTTTYPDEGLETTDYEDQVFPNFVEKQIKETTNGPTINKRDYMDGLGRKVLSVSLGENDRTIRTLNLYDADDIEKMDRVVGPFYQLGTSFDFNPAPPSISPETRTWYDAKNRVILEETKDSVYEWNPTTHVYYGLTETIIDPDNKQRKQIKDHLGRVIQVVEYNGAEQYNTNYTYNAAGDLTQIKNHYNTLTTIAYNRLGQKTSFVDPDMGTWTYLYDANGNLKQQKNSRNEYTNLTYDNRNRIKQKSFSTTYTPTTYVYDAAPLNGKGQLRSISNGDATTVYNEYDAMGRVKSFTKTITGDNVARSTTFSYDYAGKQTRIGYPDGFQLYYEYRPGTGLLHKAKGSDFVEYAVLSDYEAWGKPGQMTHGNQTSTFYEYDPESMRLSGITTRDPSGLPANNIQEKLYTYTPAGDVETLSDLKDNNTIYYYTYDGLHRLVSETNSGTYAPVSYTYNAIGNIMTKTVGANTLTYTYHATKKHAVANISVNGTARAFTYDNAGNMLTGFDLTGFPSTPPTRTMTYNAENMPSRIQYTSSGTTQDTRFYYDGELGRARKEIIGGSSTYYFGDHFERISGADVKYVFANNLRIARIQGTAKVYFHKDHLDSSSAVTGSTGVVLETSKFMPFGELRTHTGTNQSDYKYTDQEQDATTNLYNYGARLYDPAIGLFTTPDPYFSPNLASHIHYTKVIENSPYPIIYPGSFKLDEFALYFSNPQRLNRFAYVQNNPINFVDPLGLFLLNDHFVITFCAAREVGMTRAESIELALKVAAVDFRDGSNDTAAASANQHALSGEMQDGNYQTEKQAIEGTNEFISNSINVNGDLEGALHAEQDKSVHAFEKWFGEITLDHILFTDLLTGDYPKDEARQATTQILQDEKAQNSVNSNSDD